MKKHYLVYQITNLVNQKIYIGIHTTRDIDDGYMGSSVYLKRSIEKYGIENFKREILFDFESAKEMIDKEREMVDEDFVSRNDTFNINLGGGSFYFVNINGLNNSPAHIAKMKMHYANPIFKEKFKLSVSDGLKRVNFNHKTFLGKSHSEETKKRIGEKTSKIQQGEGNSQFGTCWIHHLELKISKKIKNNELDSFLSEGWIKGRKMKF